MITNDFFTFVNSLVGVRNFIRNHPKPVIEYYWVIDHTQIIYQIAEKFDIQLKKIRVIADKNAPNLIKDDEYPVYPEDPIFYGSECYGGIEAVQKNISKAAYLVDLKSNDIVQNETLWEKCVYLQNEFSSIRYSSDEFEYYSRFKTGWAYLSENFHVELDSLLISFLKNRDIALKKERVDSYISFPTGNLYSIDTVNGLMAFRTHPIDENLIPIIINDPIQWEGIFYDQDFCNKSILQYIKKAEPQLDESFFL